MNPYSASNRPPDRPPRAHPTSTTKPHQPPKPHPHQPYPTPDIPGHLIPPEMRDHVQNPLREIIPGFNGRFPGAQPVSMTHQGLNELERKSFWVCEKTDGVRVMLLILWNSLAWKQDLFLIDRKNDYRQIEGLVFPHPESPLIGPRHLEAAASSGPQSDAGWWCKTTLLDGELVLDLDKRSGKYVMRYYLFDMLVHNGVNMMTQNLEKRYGKMDGWLVRPQEKYYTLNPEWRANMPFEIVKKPMELAYGLDKVLLETIPRLEHGQDGLIFTAVDEPYVIGEDRNILKWKPPNENSIDFKLTLRFDASPENSHLPDLTSKPLFLLYVYRGGRGPDGYLFHDRMVVSDEEWEEWKATGDQYDERIVECCWDEELQSWKFMRFRDDKHDGNFIDIGDKIINSIKDGVIQEQLIERIPAIRAGQKERRAKAARLAPPPPAPTSAPEQPKPRPVVPAGMPRPGGYSGSNGGARGYGGGMMGGGGYAGGAPGGGLRR